MRARRERKCRHCLKWFVPDHRHLKELLGHESLDTLQHYARLTVNDLKKEHQRCHPRERDIDPPRANP